MSTCASASSAPVPRPRREPRLCAGSPDRAPARRSIQVAHELCRTRAPDHPGLLSGLHDLWGHLAPRQPSPRHRPPLRNICHSGSSHSGRMEV